MSSDKDVILSSLTTMFKQLTETTKPLVLKVLNHLRGLAKMIQNLNPNRRLHVHRLQKQNLKIKSFFSVTSKILQGESI